MDCKHPLSKVPVKLLQCGAIGSQQILRDRLIDAVSSWLYKEHRVCCGASKRRHKRGTTRSYVYTTPPKRRYSRQAKGQNTRPAGHGRQPLGRLVRNNRTVKVIKAEMGPKITGRSRAKFSVVDTSFAPVAVHYQVGIDICPAKRAWRKGVVKNEYAIAQ